jgi:hypothetical protein
MSRTASKSPGTKHRKPRHPKSSNPARPHPRPRSPKKPKQPGKPKKKTGAQREAAHKRGAELSAMGWIDDPVERRKAEVGFQRRYIDADLLAKEAALQATVWPEYGYDTPLQRTQRFAQEYYAAYRRAHAKYIDPDGTYKPRPIHPNLGMNAPADITSLWKARQFADEHGQPYDLAIDLWMDGKVGNQKHKQPPMPNQLLSGRQTKARLRGHPTNQEVADRLFRSDWDRRFFAERLQDDPVQAAAMEKLRIGVLMAKDSAKRLAKYMSVPGLLNEHRARVMFDPMLVDAAMALVGRMPWAKTASPAPDFLPGCYGNRIVAKDSVCNTCAFATDCSRFKASVTRRMGTTDPKGDHKRQVDRERQRRHRKKPKPEGVLVGAGAKGSRFP